MLSQDGKVWETKDRARTKTDVHSPQGWGATFSTGLGKEARTKVTENSSRCRSLPEPPAHKGRAVSSFFNNNTGVPCLMLCLRSWGAHDNLQFPSQTEVKISVLGLIDAMGVLPVALFITVLFYSAN